MILESVALLQNRLGLDPALRFLRECREFKHHWITPELHNRGVEKLNRMQNRGISFVDCVTFTVMEEFEIKHALAFDSDFENEGFTLMK